MLLTKGNDDWRKKKLNDAEKIRRAVDGGGKDAWKRKEEMGRKGFLKA